MTYGILPVIITIMIVTSITITSLASSRYFLRMNLGKYQKLSSCGYCGSLLVICGERSCFCGVLSQPLGSCFVFFPVLCKPSGTQTLKCRSISLANEQRRAVLISLSCHNKVPETWGLTTEICSLPTLESKVCGVGRAILPLKALEEKAPCLFQLLMAPGVPCSVAVSLRSLFLSSRGLLLCASLSKITLFCLY